MFRKTVLKLYDILWMLVLPGVLAYLWWRGGNACAYRQGWGQRLGLGLTKSPVDIWIHAVSVGEVMAARPLIEAWLAQGQKVLVTCMTPTGAAQIHRCFGHRVLQQYCPYDFWLARQRFLQAYQPKVWVIMETELWPGWLSAVAAAEIPIFLVNARISNRSYGRYCYTKWLWSLLLNAFTKIYVQSRQDKERFIAIGANPLRVEIAGNLKFYQQEDQNKVEYWQAMRTYFAGREILVFGSTHPGEEAMILATLQALKQSYPNMLAILVPRHPERFDEVFALIKAQGLRAASWSKWLTERDPCLDLLLIDQMGELSSLYVLADLAFVGGSLVPVGGHNILEPMHVGVAVLCGPYMQNQQAFMELFEQKQALVVVKDEADLRDKIGDLLADSAHRQALVRNGSEIIKANQAALAICLAGIDAYLH